MLQVSIGVVSYILVAILTCFANSTGYEKRLCTMTPVSSIKMGDLNAVGVLESTKILYT
jgi:hypothetical protein